MVILLIALGVAVFLCLIKGEGTIKKEIETKVTSVKKKIKPKEETIVKKVLKKHTL